MKPLWLFYSHSSKHYLVACSIRCLKLLDSTSRDWTRHHITQEDRDFSGHKCDRCGQVPLK